jgi:hypothetical protein
MNCKVALQRIVMFYSLAFVDWRVGYKLHGTSVLSIGGLMPRRSRYFEVLVSTAQLMMRLDFVE